MSDRLFDGGRGDFVQQNAPDVGLGFADALGDMPSDCLAFAVRVAREVDVVFILGGALDFADYLLFSLDNDVLGGEVVLDIDAQGAFRQVHHVAHRRHHLEIATHVAFDSFRLGWRFNDYKILCHYSRASGPVRGPSRRGLSCPIQANEKSLPGCWATRPVSSSSSNNLSTVWALSPEISIIESTWSLSSSVR